MEGREKDIQKLCDAVLSDCYPNYNDNQGEYSCPFCGCVSYEDEISEIKHDSDCAYLIAQDLSTNLRS